MRNIFSTAIPPGPAAYSFSPVLVKSKRIESIDFLRGVVMVIMAIDHVRDYFHQDAFYYSPTDLSQTTVALFFTRWITHFCAPVFVFLAGTSAYLYGRKTSKKELSVFLLTRGLWLIFLELFILGLFRTFNPTFHYFNLQVIWVIGVSMIVLSGLIYLNRYLILLIGALLIAGHNLLDNVHVTGNNLPAFLWSLLHNVNYFTAGGITVYVHYPLLPWIGVMALGYFIGNIYAPNFDQAKRKMILMGTGIAAIILFVILRSGNFYGDPANWSVQKNFMFSVLSFLNVSKYPPSLLYLLMTLGPALILVSLLETVSAEWKSGFVIFGRTPMFYYLAHMLLIHVFALVGAVISGYKWSDMILTTGVNNSPQLKGYGFGLFTVYLVWISLIIVLYPLCKAYERYKRNHLSQQRWLSYL
jgi:uncharacterized membrane protein